MTLEDELELIEAAKTQREAFVKLYRAYVDRVYGYCFLRLPSQEVAEDVTSNVFTKLIEGIQKFDTDQGYRLSAWLFRVAHNLIVDYYRKTKPEHIDWGSEVDSSESDKNDKFLKQHTRKQQIASVLPRINKRYQQVISLKFFAELETEEIAVQLGIKNKNVYLLLHRALTAFRQEFEKNYEKSEIFF